MLSEKRIKKPNEISEKLFEEKLITGIKYIFDIFDSDSDGFISPEKIDIQGLPTNILEIFAPILCEMDDLKKQLNFEDFFKATERLLRTLSIIQKNLILK